MTCKEDLTPPEFNTSFGINTEWQSKLKACTGTYICNESDQPAQEFVAGKQGKTVAAIQNELYDPSQHNNEGTFPNNVTQTTYKKALAQDEMHVSSQTSHATVGPHPQVS